MQVSKSSCCATRHSQVLVPALHNREQQLALRSVKQLKQACLGCYSHLAGWKLQAGVGESSRLGRQSHQHLCRPSTAQAAASTASAALQAVRLSHARAQHMKWAATYTATAAPQAAHAPPGSLLTRQLSPCRPVPQHSTKARHLRILPSGPHLQELPVAGILLHTATATQSTGVGCCRCWGGAGGIQRRLEGGHQVCRDAWVVGPRCHNVLQTNVGSSLREGSRTMAVAEAGSDRQHPMFMQPMAAAYAHLEWDAPAARGAMLRQCHLCGAGSTSTLMPLCAAASQGAPEIPWPHAHVDSESSPCFAVLCSSPEGSTHSLRVHLHAVHLMQCVLHHSSTLRVAQCFLMQCLLHSSLVKAWSGWGCSSVLHISSSCRACMHSPYGLSPPGC